MKTQKTKEQNVIASQYSWDQYFMTMAYLISTRSKDPSTRVGAVIVDRDHQVRSTGYNGLPRHVSDSYNRYHDRDFKSITANHAEESAIIACARTGIQIKECTIYTIWQPCAMCSKMIIQAGIERVVFDKNFPGNETLLQENWQYSMKISHDILEEAGIKITCMDEALIKIEGLYKAKAFDPFFRK